MGEERKVLGKSKEDIVKYAPLYFYELTPALKKKAKDELHENEEAKEVLAKLKALMEKSDGYSNILIKDEDFLPFLRWAKYDLKKAHTICLNHITLLRTYDKLFKDFMFSSCLKPIQSNTLCFLPQRDADGCIIILVLFRHCDLSECSFVDITRAASIGFIDNLKCSSTQINGIKVIVDCTGVSLSVVTHIPFWIIKYSAVAMQGSVPVRLKEFHIVNIGSFVMYMWAIMGPLLSKKLKQRVHFHSVSLSLHKYISPSVLPEELGGQLGPADNSEWLRTLSESEESITAYIRRARNEQ